MNAPLSDELRALLDACASARRPVLVIGAFSVRPYDCLCRVSGALDLAIASEHWPRLKEALASLGFETISEGRWATASKNLGEEALEAHIALDNVAERGLNFPHHHPRFDFDERALTPGAALMARAAAEYVLK
jgi:metal-dependent amidase/aminoacylase/carboxypeptidase family protein